MHKLQPKSKKAYKDIFELRGAEYHDAMMEYPEARAQEFEAVINTIQEHKAIHANAAILDIPAGGGYFKAYLPEGINYIAAEDTKAFGDQVNRIHGLQPLIIKDDSLPLEQGSLDGIVSIAGLHHRENLPIFFTELRRVLKKDGFLCLADVAAGSCEDEFLNSFVNQHNSFGHEGVFFSSKTQVQLSDSGFKIISSQPVSYHWVFKSQTEMLNFTRKLFGLDLASDDQILQAISTIQGFETQAGICTMRWSLTHIFATL